MSENIETALRDGSIGLVIIPLNNSDRAVLMLWNARNPRSENVSPLSSLIDPMRNVELYKILVNDT